MKLSEIAKRAGKRILNASLDVVLFPYESAKNVVYNLTHPIQFAKYSSEPYAHPVKSFKEDKKRTIKKWATDLFLVAALTNFLLPNYIKPENIKNTQVNLQYQTQVGFEHFRNYKPQTTDVDLKDKKLEKLILKETNYHFSQENKRKINVLLLEKSKKPLNELSVNESIKLASDITGDILDYGYEGKQPKSVDEMLERGEGVCRHYNVFNIAVFNLLKEQNKNLSNAYMSGCHGLANQIGWLEKVESLKRIPYIRNINPAHAWNRVATVTDKDKILVTYIDPTWDDGHHLGLISLDAYNKPHKPRDEFEAIVKFFNGVPLEKQKIWTLTKAQAYENIGDINGAIKEYDKYVNRNKNRLKYYSTRESKNYSTQEEIKKEEIKKEIKKLNELEKHIAELKQML